MITIRRIKDIKTALELFEESSITHGEAIAQNYKVANRAYKNIAKAVEYLRTNGNLIALETFLSNKNTNTRLWAASYLIKEPLTQQSALKALEEIKELGGPMGRSAYHLIMEWHERELK